MGLNQGGFGRPPAVTWPHWQAAAVVAAIASAIAVLGASGRDALRYDRAEIAAGELWRLLSGHFTHLGPTHLMLNLAGLGLVWILVAARLTMAGWIAASIVIIAGIDAGLWWLEPQLEWYVGLSGVLHGLLAAGIAAGLRLRLREAGVLAVVVTGKLIYEQLAGPLPGSEASAGGTVIVAAHLYGTLAGAFAGSIAPVSAPSAPI